VVLKNTPVANSKSNCSLMDLRKPHFARTDVDGVKLELSRFDNSNKSE